MESNITVCCNCGACCATYRITIPRIELASHSAGWVPVELTDPYTPTTSCMREHPDVPSRCIALDGEIGNAVRCSIYAQRPSACREFAPLSALGIGDDACAEARRRFGLSPLDRL